MGVLGTRGRVRPRRNAPAFSRFFDALSFCHAELLNYSNVARDCGVDSKTVVREYFQILVDTLLGVFVEPFSPRRSRAVITRAPKFYLFDVGVAGHVTGIERAHGAEFGRALEHLVLMELLAYYLGSGSWNVKGSARVRPGELRAMRAYMEEHQPRQAVVVCNEDAERRTGDGIWILPWERFLELWTDANHTLRDLE